jgi:hypothetical protein
MTVCKKHNIEKRKGYNSNIKECPKCKIEKNNSKLKRQVKKVANKTGAKAIDKKLDAAWSELVKLKAGYKCEYCGITRSLNSHHIYSRQKKSVRWKTINGICLCVNHHIGGAFSAHKTPVTFVDWLRKYRGVNKIELLTIKANATSHYSYFEKELMLKELLDEIKQLKKKL